MTIRHWSRLCAGALLASTMFPAAQAADVTYQRLMNSASENANWLSVHKDYNASRFTAVDQINRSTVANLKVAYAIALGGTEPGSSSQPQSRMQSTPLVEDGMMYVTDGWSGVYAIDVRDGKKGRIVWRMDPGVDRSTTWIPANRGAALYGNRVISITTDNRVISMDRETGRVMYDVNLQQADCDAITAAPLVVSGNRVIVGMTGGDRGCRSWITAVDAADGKTVWRTYAIPGPGEPGHETWADPAGVAWKTGGAAFWYTGAFDPTTNVTYWGTGQPVPMYDADYRPGDNLYTNSTLALDVASGKIVWYFQYTPNDRWDYDEVGSHMLYDVQIGGETRKVLGRFARNGFYYNIDRTNGSFITASQYVKNLNWTKGIDPKTGKPLDYDPSSKIQLYNAAVAQRRGGPEVQACPDLQGGVNLFPTAYNPRTRLAFGAGIDGCFQIRVDQTRMGGPFWNGGLADRRERMRGHLSSVDIVTGQTKVIHTTDYPSYGGVLATAGGLVFSGTLDGTFAAHDEQTLAPVWSFNVGTPITAAPMTFMVNNKQYIAIVVGGGQILNTGLLKAAPELHNLRSSAQLYVFTL